MFELFSYSISIYIPPSASYSQTYFVVAHPPSQLNSLFGLICRLTPTVCHWPSRAQPRQRCFPLCLGSGSSLARHRHRQRHGYPVQVRPRAAPASCGAGQAGIHAVKTCVIDLIKLPFHCACLCPCVFLCVCLTVSAGDFVCVCAYVSVRLCVCVCVCVVGKKHAKRPLCVCPARQTNRQTNWNWNCD